jgi:hypothetical protein
MRANLDDTAREALQFLLLGAGVVLLARLAHAGLVLYLDRSQAGALEAAAAPFGQGYLLPGGRTTVAGAIAPAGRLALGALLTLIAGAVAAVVVGAVVRLARMPLRNTLWPATRAAMALTGLWCLHAVLMLPPAATRITDSGIEVVQRRAFLGQVSWPLPARTVFVPWADITRTATQTTADALAPRGERYEVVVDHRAGSVVVADLAPEGGDASAARHQALEACHQLEAALRPLAQGL